MNYLRRVAGCTVSDRVRSSDTVEEFGEEQLAQVCRGGEEADQGLSSSAKMFNC